MTDYEATEDNNSASSRRASKSRPVTAVILVILASLGVAVSLVGWWVRSTLFETEAFMEVVETTLSSEEVTTLLGDAVSEQVVTALDIERRLEDGLGGIDTYLSDSLADALGLSDSARTFFRRLDLLQLADLAAPIAAPINQAIENGVDDLVRSDIFQKTLPDAVASAHQGAVALITEDIEDLENVSLVDGEVRWNILPAVTMAIAYLFDAGSLPPIIEPVEVPEATYDEPPGEGIIALGEALGERLPDDFGVVTIMSADQLRNWQSIARFLDRAVYGAVFVTLLLVVAALMVSGDRRRTVVQIALGSVVAVLVAWIVQRNVLAAVDAAIGGPGQQAAAEVLFEAVFGSLRSISLIYIVVAGVVGVAAHIAGRPRWMMALRNFGQSDRDNESRATHLDGVIGEHRDAFIAGGLLIAVGIWWWVGISLASVVAVVAVLGAYLWYVTRVAAPAVEGSKVQAATRRNRR